MKPRLLITIYANPDYYPPTVNAVAILQNYFDVHILSRNMDPPTRNWPPGVSIDRFGEYASARDKEAESPRAKLTELCRFIAHTRATVADIRPALIYAYDPYAFVATLAARPRRSIPVIFHLHELAEPALLPLTSLQRWVVKIAQLATRSAAAVVFPEKFRACHWLAAARDSRPPIIVPNCPGPDYFSPPADWNQLLADRFLAREAVYVGSASAENGHLDGLRAIPLLAADFRLRVIGYSRPEFTAAFDLLAHQLDIAHRVSLDGWLPAADLLARASRATLGLSLHKPHDKNFEFLGSASNKLFEYAAMGLPVVMPDRPSYRDFFRDAPWVAYANIDDPRSIASTISRIVSDRDQYFAISLAARRAFADHYNYPRVFAPALRRIIELAAVTAEIPAPLSGLDDPDPPLSHERPVRASSAS